MDLFPKQYDLEKQGLEKKKKKRIKVHKKIPNTPSIKIAQSKILVTTQ